MASTKDVIGNHIRRFRAGEIKGILDDFSVDALLFTPAGLLRGRGEIERFFQALLAEFGKPGASDAVCTTALRVITLTLYGARKQQTTFMNSRLTHSWCKVER
jgi:ketosteroid isomerase-like protein